MPCGERAGEESLTTPRGNVQRLVPSGTFWAAARVRKIRSSAGASRQPRERETSEVGNVAIKPGRVPAFYPSRPEARHWFFLSDKNQRGFARKVPALRRPSR